MSGRRPLMAKLLLQVVVFALHMRRSGGTVATTHDQDERSGEDRAGSLRIMGDLEAEIMECVWDLGSATVKDIHRCLLERREIAYTTVMTVMSRLATKGYLRYHAKGRAYVYEAATSREDLYSGVVRDFMSGVVADADRQVLANFVDSVAGSDLSRLDLLSQIIEEKRRERSAS
jgi:predicted transcriptional regulator